MEILFEIILHLTLQTLNSDVHVGFLCSGAVLCLNSVDTTVVPISITDEQTTGANASCNLNVYHSPLVNLFALLVPDDLRDRTSGDAAAKLNILSGLQSKHLVGRPFDLGSN